MPSAFTHAISAIALSGLFKRINSVRLFLTGAICSALPDIDALGFHYGVPYNSLWGHRGITHSFFFAAIVSVIVCIVFYKRTKIFTVEWFTLFIYFFIATSLHPILDALTNGGLGVAFFAPVDNTRYFFSWRPVKVAPISVGGFFTDRGWQVFKSELLFIWIPSILLMVIMSITKKRKSFKSTD
jgi:inner membrane protein